MKKLQLIAAISVLSLAACGGSSESPKKNTNSNSNTNTSECGDGVRDAGEVCDGSDLASQSCADQGFAGGTLACAADCMSFVTSACISCGDDRRQGTEVCDGSDLGGQTCALQGLGGGTLGCTSDCSAYDTSACSGTVAECGNETLDGSEVCDGTNLDGATCESLGLGTGSLACGTSCLEYDTSGCTGPSDDCSGPDTYSTATVNVDIPDGDPCNFDSDCASGTCNSSYYCGTEDQEPNTHDADLALGQACDVDASCASAFCYQTNEIFVCAEACTEPVEATTPGLSCQAVEGSAVGSACIPGPGAGAIGESCTSGVFECADGVCLEGFCTRLPCDPADPDSCAEVNPVDPTNPPTCEFLVFDFNFSEVHTCVPQDQIGTASEGEECAFPFSCEAGTVCNEDVCLRQCPNGDECVGDTFCAADAPGGPICLPNDAQVGLGEICDFSSQCPANAMCFNEGQVSRCRAECDSAGDCGSSEFCVQVATGPALDTQLRAYSAAESASILAEDDDGGENFFSRIELPVAAGAQDLWLEVVPFPNGSPVGDYRLLVSLGDESGATVLAEIEPNDDLASAQDLTGTALPLQIDANLEGTDDVADGIDAFKISLNPAGPSTLIARTARTVNGLCLDEPDLLADGEACTDSASCENDCFPYTRGSGPSFCASPCTGDTDCGGATGSCVAFMEGSTAASYCFPAGSESVGDGALGAICDGPQDCASRMCVSHKFSNEFRCADTCTTVDSACGGSGFCTGTNPTYGTACVPTLGGAVAPGGSCSFDADCQSGNVCNNEVCQPSASITRYDVNPDVVEGLPCNIDDDCSSGLECRNFSCRTSDALNACANGASDDVIDSGELCDGAAAIATTCADLGAGTGTVSCGVDCQRYDTSACSGFAAGAPCNVDSECSSGYCFDQIDTFFCADTCTGVDDTSCTDTLFAADLATNCTDDGTGQFACLPNGGVGATADPCKSGFLDCASGQCFDATFCIDDCSLTDTDCGRDARCVSYAVDREVDTEIAIVDSEDQLIAGPADANVVGGTLIDLWSQVQYTNPTASSEFVWVKVSSFPFISDDAPTFDADSGDYQLQCFSSDNAPPFTSTVLESELGATPVANNTLLTSQDIANLPSRVAANLEEISPTEADVDYYRVLVNAGQTVSAVTTYPLDQVCWPTSELQRDDYAECSFDFECKSGTCLGYCAPECTDGSSCTAGFKCGNFAPSLRSYCVESLRFNDSCATALTGQAGDTPSCPNSLCVGREGQFTCSADCLNDSAGTGCGQFDSGTSTFNGECLDLSGESDYACIPHLQQSVAAGGSCIVDNDCASGCCDPASFTCSTEFTSCNLGSD